MKTRFLITMLLATWFAASVFAQDETAADRARTEAIKARLAEHARKNATHGVTHATPPARSDIQASNVGAPVTTPGSSGQKTTAEAAKPVQESATVLPKVEVKNGKITELDRQLAKQNVEIAREKKYTKPTPLDEVLNGPKVASALALFGGQSSEDRANVSKERVSMMDDERDIIEAIAQADTKEEKAELERTLSDMREMRRELERSLR